MAQVLARALRDQGGKDLDHVLAAAALANGLALYSCNPANFDGLAGCTVAAAVHPG